MDGLWGCFRQGVTFLLLAQKKSNQKKKARGEVPATPTENGIFLLKKDYQMPLRREKTYPNAVGHESGRTNRPITSWQVRDVQTFSAGC